MSACTSYVLRETIACHPSSPLGTNCLYEFNRGVNNEMRDSVNMLRVLQACGSLRGLLLYYNMVTITLVLVLIHNVD